MNCTTEDIHGSLTSTIDDSTAWCCSFFFRVISRVILGYPFVIVNRIVLITYVSSRVWSSVRKLVKTITSSEEFKDFVSAINLHISSWCRSSVTTTIHMFNTCQSATIDDDLGWLCGVLTTFRLISCQIATAIDCFDVKRLSALCWFSADIFLVCILRSIDVNCDITLRRTVHIVATKYLMHDSTGFAIIRCNSFIQMNFHITLCGSCRTNSFNIIRATLTSSEHTAEVVILSCIIRINDLRTYSSTIDIHRCILSNNTDFATAIDTALHGTACHV